MGLCLRSPSNMAAVSFVAVLEHFFARKGRACSEFGYIFRLSRKALRHLIEIKAVIQGGQKFLLGTDTGGDLVNGAHKAMLRQD